MPKFSQRSQTQLDTCHPDLQRICNEVIKVYDFSAICGHRDKPTQQIAFDSGKSKLKFPDSKHNKMPSMAIDICPWPINWKNVSAFKFLAGHMQMAAHMLYNGGKTTHILRWGGDWDCDNDMTDQKFNDLPHFELIKPIK